MKNGILVINKPKGFTSFDIVAKTKKILNTSKVGHTGTLDPLATGVLVVLIGRAAKFQKFLQNNIKKYIADIKFGITSDTQDITGKIIYQNFDFNFSLSDLNNVIKRFEGETLQIPPMFSALKKDGNRLYKLARQGITIDRTPRKIFIDYIKILNFDSKKKIAKIEVCCGSGTYIRSLCEDIGSELKCGAVMENLCRTECNGFVIDESLSIEQINEKNILSVDILFKNYPALNITDKQLIRFKNGGNLALNRLFYEKKFTDKMIFRLYQNNDFIGLGRIDIKNNELKILKSL